MGIKMGAKMAHLAEPLPIKIFRKATKVIYMVNMSGPVKPVDLRNSAPFMARMVSSGSS
jgi:hypothetical protein